MATNRFSKKYGHRGIEVPISIRNEAPQALRDFIVQLAYSLHCKSSFLRSELCQVLRVRPDTQNNWSDSNIDWEIHDLLNSCAWYYVYDFMEALWEEMNDDVKLDFQEEINAYFKETGIGLKMELGEIGYRGDENFEVELQKAEISLTDRKLTTAAQEIREAIHDLSRRPEPDITGAIQHSLACLECVSREVAGDSKATLGELIKKYPGIVPKPLDIAIEKIWGFSSEQGRHLREGNPPGYDEAELVVSISAAISHYMITKFKPMSDSNTNPFADLPF